MRPDHRVSARARVSLVRTGGPTRAAPPRCSTGSGLSGGSIYTLVNVTVLGKPVWKNADWFIVPTWWPGWIWQPSLTSNSYWQSVSQVAPPWAWTGAITATCSCPAGLTLSTSRATWGKCLSTAPSTSGPCDEGFVRATPGATCTACPSYAVASGSACVCPAGYSSAGGGACTPPAQVSLTVGGGVDPALAGNFTLVGSNSTAAGAPFPVYGRAAPYWPATPAGSYDVLLTYLPVPRNWALVSTGAGAPRLAFASAPGQTIALPLGSTLSALVFNATDASAFSTPGSLQVVAGSAGSGAVSSLSAYERGGRPGTESTLANLLFMFRALRVSCRSCDELRHFHHDRVPHPDGN